MFVVSASLVQLTACKLAPLLPLVAFKQRSPETMIWD